MSMLKRPLSAIRGALVLMSVVLVTVSPGVAQASSGPAVHAVSHHAHVVRTAAEAWG